VDQCEECEECGASGVLVSVWLLRSALLSRITQCGGRSFLFDLLGPFDRRTAVIFIRWRQVDLVWRVVSVL